MTDTTTSPESSTTSGLSRRRLLGAGAGLAGVGAIAAGGYLAASRLTDGGAVDAEPLADAVPFHGEHQAGIVTPAQDRLHFVSFDVTTEKRSDLVDMLREWTKAAERMTEGRDAGPVGAVEGPADAPPDDTGEALGLPPSALTLTVGFGSTLFTNAAGRDRFGVASRRPAALADLPAFPGEDLNPALCGGDIAVQACAHDPQVAVHAVRNLARIGFGAVAVRWSQLGFGRTSSTTRKQTTPRNLMGFKDGTRNLKAEDTELLTKHLWVPPSDGPEWMTGGSYMVTRRIRMHIETWDRTRLVEQEQIFGRYKKSGAPLSGPDDHGVEFHDFEPDTVGSDGQPIVPAVAHIRLAHASANAGARLLRRGYNFVDGSDGLGRLDAGLFFIAYQRDPRRQFVPIQRNLASADELNEYIKHVSSGLFACPPGVRPGGYWGESLFR